MVGTTAAAACVTASTGGVGRVRASGSSLVPELQPLLVLFVSFPELYMGLDPLLLLLVPDQSFQVSTKFKELLI